MRRQILDDGRWFTRENARVYKEARRWNGRTYVSQATGSESEHEELWRTRSGRWILHHWSNWIGTAEQWREVTAEQAASWLTANGYDQGKAAASPCFQAWG